MNGQPRPPAPVVQRIYGVLLSVVIGIALAVSLVHWWAS